MAAGSALLDLLERLRAASIAQDAGRTIAVHQAGASTLVVEQEALGVHTQTGAPFALPNVAVIDVDADGLIARVRDYVHPAAVAEVLGDPAR